MSFVRQQIDHLSTSLLQLGRAGLGLTALKPTTDLIQVRNSADSAYADVRLRYLVNEGWANNSRVPGVKPQTVLAGQTTAAGLPDLLVAGGGLFVNLNTSSTRPLIVSFGDGYDVTGGAKCFVQATTQSGYAISGLTANTTNYIYAQRYVDPASTAEVRNMNNFGTTTLAPIYSAAAPASPASGQHWFCTALTVNSSGQSGNTMYRWTGSAWQQEHRVFLGEAVTGASSVTSVVSYAYNRQYRSAWTSVGLNQSTNFAHNFGMDLASAQAAISVFARANSSDTSIVPALVWIFAGNSYGVTFDVPPTIARNNLGLLTGAAGIYLATGGVWATTADIQLVLSGGW